MKVTGGAASKLSKIRVVRKSIARYFNGTYTYPKIFFPTKISSEDSYSLHNLDVK